MSVGSPDDCPIFWVDFNEMLDFKTLLFSRGEMKNDIHGKQIKLQSGMRVCVEDEDDDEQGNRDDLFAFGEVIENPNNTAWASGVRWCCRIDESGIQHRSDAKKQ